jgi:hypothetical protein
MHHRTADVPETTGRVIRRARWYDLISRKMSFGGGHARPADRAGLARRKEAYGSLHPRRAE